MTTLSTKLGQTVTLFRERSSYPLPDAQDNLGGRTHYVDSATLSFHGSRILGRLILADGLFFVLFESCAANWEKTKRVHRYVMFDVFGTVVSRVSLRESFSSQDRARKAFWSWYNGFDTERYYRDALIARAERLVKEADELLTCAELAVVTRAA